ncbi:hypothetical protein ACU4GD_08275 [Cupriavidus basilensis]
MLDGVAPAAQGLAGHAARLQDDTVGIDNATQIFIAAKHPKSFVSLDRADHLPDARKEDAVYVAQRSPRGASAYLDIQGGRGARARRGEKRAGARRESPARQVPAALPPGPSPACRRAGIFRRA